MVMPQRIMNLRREQEARRRSLVNQPDEILLHIFKNLDEKDLENLLTVPSLRKVFEKYEGDFPPPSSLPADCTMWINAHLETIKQGEKTETVQNVSFEIKLANQELVFKYTSFQKIKRYLKAAGSVALHLKGTVPDFFQVDNVNYGKLKNHLRNCSVKRVRIWTRRVGSVTTDIALLFPETIEVSCSFEADELQSQPDTFFGLNISNLVNFGFLPVQMGVRLLAKNIKMLDIGCEGPLSLDRVIEEWQLGQREITLLALSFPLHVRHGLVNKRYMRVINGVERKLKLTVEHKSYQEVCVLQFCS